MPRNPLFNAAVRLATPIRRGFQLDVRVLHGVFKDLSTGRMTNNCCSFSLGVVSALMRERMNSFSSHSRCRTYCPHSRSGL